jgi:hypothetical protein
MKKIIAVLSLLSACHLSAGDSGGAIANLQALPQDYRNGILKVSADNADPNPDIWYVTAQSSAKKSGIQNFQLASTQVVSEKPALGLREIFSSAKPIDLSKVQLDSRDAFDIAQRYALANGKTIGSVSFILNQQGDSAVPIWSVWCYAPNGTYLGEMQLLATDGSVIANDAFPKKP